MDNMWNYIGLYLGLDLFGVCSGYPVSPTDLGASVGWSSLLAAAFLVSSVVFLVGCLCCRQTKGFQVFTDSTSNIAAASTANPDAAATEFTIFPPPGGSANQEVRFEPLPDIGPPRANEKRPAAYNNAVTSGLPSAQDWFGSGEGAVARSQLQYVRELGRGWFGRVLHATLRGATPCAVRVLREDAAPADRAYFLHEAGPYRRLRHPNVLGAVGWCLEADPLLVLLEDCPNGDLKSFLLRNRPAAAALCDQGVTLNMACDIAAGLQHMHDHDFLHTDLAARNCLLGSDLTVKVGDYGIGIEAFERDYYVAGNVAVPVRWAAPETLRCTETTIETGEVTVAANVWSYGVVLWEIAEWGELPYAELTDDEVVGEVMGGGTRRLPAPTRPAPHQHDLYQLMRLCWSPALQRPALRQVHAMLQHLRGSLPGDLDQAFELRWDSLKPNTIPKTDNHREVSPSHHDVSPSHHDVSPLHHDTLPKQHDVSPSHHDMSPTHHDVSPSHHDMSPSHRDMSPPHRDGLAVHSEVSPSHHDTLPAHHDMLPAHHDTSPSHREMSPPHREMTPSRCDASLPARRDTSPRQRGVSPSRPDSSPTHFDTSPSQRNSSCSPRNSSPPHHYVDSLSLVAVSSEDWQADGYYHRDSSSGSPQAGRWDADGDYDSDDDEAGFEERVCAAIQDLDDVLALASSEEVTAKVREKSRSVADLMVLTHIDQLDSIGSEPFSGAFHASAVGGAGGGGAFRDATTDGAGGEGAFHASAEDGAGGGGAFRDATADGASGEGAFHASAEDGAGGKGAFGASTQDSASREAVEGVFHSATQDSASKEAVEGAFHASTQDSASKEVVEGIFHSATQDSASRETVEDIFRAATQDSSSREALEGVFHSATQDSASREAVEDAFHASTPDNASREVVEGTFHASIPDSASREAVEDIFCNATQDGATRETSRLGSEHGLKVLDASRLDKDLKILEASRLNIDTENTSGCGSEETSRQSNGEENSRVVSSDSDETVRLGRGTEDSSRPGNRNEEATKCGNEELSRRDSGNGEKMKFGRDSVSVEAPEWNCDNVCDYDCSVDTSGQTAGGSGGDCVEVSRRKRDVGDAEDRERKGNDSVELSENNVGSESVGDLGFNRGHAGVKALGLNQGPRVTEALEVHSGEDGIGYVGFHSVADASERNIVNGSVEVSERLLGDDGSLVALNHSGGIVVSEPSIVSGSVEASEHLLGDHGIIEDWNHSGGIEALTPNIVNGSLEVSEHLLGDNGISEASEHSGGIEASETNTVSESIKASELSGDNGSIEALGFSVLTASTDVSKVDSGAGIVPIVPHGSDDNSRAEAHIGDTSVHRGVDIGRLSETLDSRECAASVDECEKTSTSQYGPLPQSSDGRVNSDDAECSSNALPNRLLDGLEETDDYDTRGTGEVVPDAVELSLDNGDSGKGLSSSKLQGNADVLPHQLSVIDNVIVPLQEIQLPDSANLKTISTKIGENILQDGSDILLGLNSNLLLDSSEVGSDIKTDAKNNDVHKDSVKNFIEAVTMLHHSEKVLFKEYDIGNDVQTGKTKDELCIDSPLNDSDHLLLLSARPENLLLNVSEVICDKTQDSKELGQKNVFEWNKGGGVIAKDMNGISASLLFIASEMDAGAFRESSEVSNNSNPLLETTYRTEYPPEVDELVKVSTQDRKEVCELDKITIEDSKIVENVSSCLLPSNEFGPELFQVAKEAANYIPLLLKSSELCSDVLLDTKEVDNVASLNYKVSELGKATTRDAKEVGNVGSILLMPSELSNNLILDSKEVGHDINLLIKASELDGDFILGGKETLHQKNVKMLPKGGLEGLRLLTKDDIVSTASTDLIQPLQNDSVNPKQIYSVVSLGPSEEYTMDYLQGLKTTYIDSEWDELVNASESVEERPDSSSEGEDKHCSARDKEVQDKIIRTSNEGIIEGTGKTRDDVLDGASETEECEPACAMEREEDAVRDVNEIKENPHTGARETERVNPIGVSEIEDVDRLGGSETEDGDRACGSETEDGDRAGGSETEDDVPIGVSETEDDVPTGVSETEDGDRVGGSEMEDAKHSSPDEESSDSGFRDNKGSLSEDAGDERYNLEDIEAELEEAFDPPDKKNGWYLHPQVDDAADDEYPPYCAADDESAMAALRNELCRQLPLANRGSGSAADFPELSEDEDDDTEYEDVQYSHYQAAPPLSPIPEEEGGEGEGGNAFSAAGEAVVGDSRKWGDNRDGTSLQEARNAVIIGRFEGLGSRGDASEAREKEERDRRFEEDIREALESHGSLGSSSGTGTDPDDSVLVEDLVDGAATVVRLRNTTAEPCDEVLSVDTETDRATIVRSGRPDTHVAFVERRPAATAGGTFTITSRLDDPASCDVGFPTAVDDHNEAERIMADLLNSGLFADQASSSVASDYSSSSGRLESLDASSASPSQRLGYLEPSSMSPLQKLDYLEPASPSTNLDYLEPSSLSPSTNLGYLEPSSLSPLANLDYVQPMTSPVAKLDYLGPSSLTQSTNLDYLEPSSLSPSANLDYVQPMTSPVAKLDYLGPSSLTQSTNLDYLEPSSLSPLVNLDYVQPMTSPVAKLDYLGPASLSPLSAVDYFSPAAMSPIDRLDALEPCSLSPVDQWDSLESTSPEVELDCPGTVPMSPEARLDFLMSGKYESVNVRDASALGSVAENDASNVQFRNNNNSLPMSGIINKKYSEPLRVDTKCVKLANRISFDAGNEEAELYFNTRLAVHKEGETERLQCEKLDGKTEIKVPSVMSSEGKKEDICPLPNNLVQVRRTELLSNLSTSSKTEELPNCFGVASKKVEPAITLNTVSRKEEDEIPIINISLLDSASTEELPNSAVMESVKEVLNNLSAEAKSTPATRLTVGAKELTLTPEVSREEESEMRRDEEELATREEEELATREEEEMTRREEEEMARREEEPEAKRDGGEEELGKMEGGEEEAEAGKEEEELASTSSMHDISFRGPGTDEMSTSFTLQGDGDEYAPDWESDTDDDSSSSGEFVWQPYSRLTEAPLQSIAEEEDEDDEDDDDDDDDDSSSEASSADFVPSAWDSEAAPSKSALRSADRKQNSQRRVRFKRQKYHCVYEYPRESPSPSPSPGGGAGAGVDYACFADWELLDEEGAAEGAEAEADWEEHPQPPPQHSRLDFYKLGSDEDYDFSTGEFLVSSTTRPFQEFGGGIGGGCQFFPGQSRSVDDIQLEFLSPSPGGASVSPGDEVDTSPSRIAHPPLSPVSPTGLGELRHTRDQLKLNLALAPPQPAHKEMIDSGIESAGGTNALRTLKAALEVSASEV